MQATSGEELTNGQETDEVHQLKNHREAQLEYGLNWYQIATARRRGELHRVQLGQKGRIYYLDFELRALAARLSTPPFTFAGAA